LFIEVLFEKIIFFLAMGVKLLKNKYESA